jgi:hypothetical protein
MKKQGNARIESGKMTWEALWARSLPPVMGSWRKDRVLMAGKGVVENKAGM